MAKEKLINVKSKIDADMLMDLLNQEGIWSEAKTTGSGGYMQITMGTNFYGFDIYVEDFDIEKAKEIADEFEPKKEVQETEAEKSGKFSLIEKPQIMIWIAAAIVILMLIAYMFL